MFLPRRITPSGSIDHQASVTGGRQGVRRADEDQSRLLAPTDDLDGKAEGSLGLR
jgi:hypothetical protein